MILQCYHDSITRLLAHYYGASHANVNYARVAFDTRELFRYIVYGVVIKMSLVINETITCATECALSPFLFLVASPRFLDSPL